MTLRKLLLIGPLLFAAALAALLAPRFAPPFAGPFSTDGEALAAADTVCRGAKGATTVRGKLIVPNRASCKLTNTTVLGSVEVRPGAVLSARGVSVGGDLVSNGAKSVGVAASSARRSLVRGSAQLAKGRTVSIAGTTIDGGLQVLENTNRLAGADVIVVRVRVNDSSEISKNTGGVMFNRNRIDENAEIGENTRRTSVQGNVVGDNLTIAKNRGGTKVRNNRAGDNIDCVDNVPRPTGGGNVGGADGKGSKTGQCARL